MNFQSNPPIDTILGRLLAFIIMFQKKIQFLKCKLAGNQEFHTRLAFQKLDARKVNQVNFRDLYQIVSREGWWNGDQDGCNLFLRYYTARGVLTYDEFLKLITPLSNKVLSQRLLIRPQKKAAILEPYLYRTLLQLLSLYLKMIHITEQLRQKIQQNEQLSYLELIEFYQLKLMQPRNILHFINKSLEGGEQFDIDVEDVRYLTYHVESGNQIWEFTQEDIREIMFPGDLAQNSEALKRNYDRGYDRNYKKSYPERENMEPAYQSKAMNFLGKTYQKTYTNPSPVNSYKRQSNPPLVQQQSNFNHSQNHIISAFRYPSSNRNQPSNNTKIQPSNYNPQFYENASYGGLYIDNFAKHPEESKIELENYMRHPKKQKEIFEDDLESNPSRLSKQSRGSAFEQY